MTAKWRNGLIFCNSAIACSVVTFLALNPTAGKCHRESTIPTHLTLQHGMEQHTEVGICIDTNVQLAFPHRFHIMQSTGRWGFANICKKKTTFFLH